MLVQLSYWLTFAILLAGTFNFNDRRLVKADADFLSVRTRLKQDHSGKGGDPKDKYFRKSGLLLFEERVVANIAAR